MARRPRRRDVRVLATPGRLRGTAPMPTITAQGVLGPTTTVPSPLYGPGIGTDTMANLIVGGTDVNLFSQRFRAEQSGPLSSTRTVVKFGSTGYSNGTPTIRISVEADDGTGKPAGWYVNGSSGARGGTGSSLGWVDFTSSATNHDLHTFTNAGALTAGEVYHLVYSNISTAPTTAYCSINSIYIYGAVLNPRQPLYDDDDYGVLLKVNTGSWSLKGGYTPCIMLTYANGSTQGQGYEDPDYGNDQSITGTSYMVRERFTVSGASRTVTGVALRVARTSGTGNLTATLEDSGGSTIDTATLVVSAIPTSTKNADGSAGRWVSGAFSQSRTLTSGQTYRVRFSTDSSTSLWIRIIQKSRSYGWSDATYFVDGYAEYTTNGSTWAVIPGAPTYDHDLQFYLTPA